MANISRETFNKMKHYVSVRLQQGVPLVDADWNEMEDIRRFELQAFLKWFVGDGVPVGNDGFRIVGIAGQIILTSKKFEVEIDLSQSTAAETLGFYSTNCRAARLAPPAAQLIGKNTAPFSGIVGKTLVFKTHNPGEPEWSSDKVTFQTDQATAAEVVAAINQAVAQLTATAGAADDFAIQGGDGTPEGAGRCLIEGWDVINDSDLCYTGQRLYGNDALAATWKVDPLPELTAPDQNRPGLVYLDVWEREVNEHEDADLTNPAIGVPTCVRFKREWVVRVLENYELSEVPKKWEVGGNEQEIRKVGHAYYPLARKQGQKIDDLRRMGLTLANFRNGWVRLPFLPKRLDADPYAPSPPPLPPPEFKLLSCHARCGEGGATGSMEIPIPPGVNRINRFRIVGERNDGGITVILYRVNLLTDYSVLLRQTIDEAPASFDVMWASAAFWDTSLDPEGSALAVLVKAKGKADIRFIGVEFMG